MKKKKPGPKARYKTKTVRRSFACPEELWLGLESLAARNGTSVSYELRALIEAKLALDDDDPTSINYGSLNQLRRKK